jgi:hypothetical protein
MADDVIGGILAVVVGGLLLGAGIWNWDVFYKGWARLDVWLFGRTVTRALYATAGVLLLIAGGIWLARALWSP